MKTFYSHSSGCRVNEAEKEEIDRQMRLNSFTFSLDKPDIFIINSCSITLKAERETRQLIYQAKKKLPKTKIVLTGCSASYWLKNNLHRDLPVDMVVDNINKKFLVDLIVKRFSPGKKADSVHPVSVFTNKFNGSGRVMIKIQDGCQRYCTFCIVPYLRGVPDSAEISEIINKINVLSKENIISEVILTAINTQAFGYDTKENFIELLKKVINKTSVPRISLGSIHPWSLEKDFFTFYKNYLPKNRLVNFFHIPLQSGSDKILNLMKRGYRKAEILEKIEKTASLNSYALIATDVITGFLDETDDDFTETYEFLKKSPINKFHVFRFSKRTKTQADYMSKKLREPSPQKKFERARALIDLGQEKYLKFMRKNLGRKSTVLFLEKRINDFREGLLDNQLPIWINIKNRFSTSGIDLAGEIRNVKVMEFKKGSLFGKII